VSEPTEGTPPSVLRAGLGGALGSGALGLVFGLLAELPWEDVKTDAGAFAIVGGLVSAGYAIRARRRAGGT
jgi:hypothetical protein